jgi:hypothetical protein
MVTLAVDRGRIAGPLRRRVCPLHSLCGHTNAGGFEGSAPDQRSPNDHIPLGRRCRFGGISLRLQPWLRTGQLDLE